MYEPNTRRRGCSLNNPELFTCFVARVCTRALTLRDAIAAGAIKSGIDDAEAEQTFLLLTGKVPVEVVVPGHCVVPVETEVTLRDGNAWRVAGLHGRDLRSAAQR